MILGYVDPESFLGGDFALDVKAARDAIETYLAIPLGVTVEEAATTVRQVANALMAQASPRDAEKIRKLYAVGVGKKRDLQGKLAARRATR